jgi:hypothetical protein
MLPLPDGLARLVMAHGDPLDVDTADVEQVCGCDPG